jgi:hypothetical protein
LAKGGIVRTAISSAEPCVKFIVFHTSDVPARDDTWLDKNVREFDIETYVVIQPNL